MRIQSRFFMGLLYLVIVRIKNTIGQSDCQINKLSADCVRKGFKDIPQNLDMGITALDASFNPIQELREDDFRRYPKLMKLRLHGITRTINESIIYPSNVFAYLKDLEQLDLSESAFDIHYHEIIWPVKLTHLNVGGMTIAHFITLNLTTLSQLGDLNASFNRIENFPAFHPEAPLYWIDLFNNPLNNVTAEHIAPYCKLRMLRIKVVKPGTLNTPLHSCDCRRLEKWMIKYGIGGLESFTCHVPLSKQVDNCEPTNFSDQMTQQWEACLGRKPASGLWLLLILGALAASLVPVAYFGISYYLKYKKSKESPGWNDSGGDGSGSDDAAPSDSGDASEPSPES